MRPTHALFVLGAAAALATPSFADLIEPQSQTRTLSGSAFADDGITPVSDSDSAQAPDFGPWTDAASAQVNLPNALGSGGSNQSSDIQATAIVANGAAFANAEAYDFDSFADAGGQSLTLVTFELTERSTYTLVGQVNAYDDGFVDLELRGGITSYHFFSASGPAQEVPVDVSGVLDAGVYTLEVRASASTSGDLFTFGYAFSEYMVTFSAAAVVQGFCDAADGALAACPCANPGLPDTGCDNAQSTGGVRADVSALDATALTGTLTGTGFPPMGTPTAIVIRANDQEATPVAFFDGLRCIGLTAFRRFSATTAVSGTSVHDFSHGAGAGTYYYQIWYRNTPVTFCDATAAANTSNGKAITW